MFRPSNRDLRHWPPSPALTIAILPYLRSAYNEIYKHSLSNLEKTWDQAVQRRPREEETTQQVADQAAANGDGRAIFDLEVEIINREVVEEGGPAERRNNFDGIPRDEDALPAQAGQGLQDGNLQAGNLQAGNVNGIANGNQGWEFRQNISTTNIASTILGALFFPAVSSLMGDLLKISLPSSWVSKQVSRSAGGLAWIGMGNGGGTKGLLQEKWGRSIIGGCLFVVLKDVVILYCKWKKARDFGKKRVVDFVRKT